MNSSQPVGAAIAEGPTDGEILDDNDSSFVNDENSSGQLNCVNYADLAEQVLAGWAADFDADELIAMSENPNGYILHCSTAIGRGPHEILVNALKSETTPYFWNYYFDPTNQNVVTPPQPITSDFDEGYVIAKQSVLSDAPSRAFFGKSGEIYVEVTDRATMGNDVGYEESRPSDELLANLADAILEWVNTSR